MQADAELTFPEGGSAKGDSQSQYRKKPEIKVTTVLAFFTMIFRDSGGIHFAIITELQKEECRGRIVSGALLRMCAFVVSLIVCSQHSFSEVTEVEVSDREAINSSKNFQVEHGVLCSCLAVAGQMEGMLSIALEWG